jgi:hypothetical protein
MGVLVDVLVGVPLAGALTAGSVALSIRSRLHRSLRLVPGRRVDVPWRWRWSLRRPAVLHRRLQHACQVVLAATGGAGAARARSGRRRRRRDQDTSILQTTGAALLDQAVILDRRLVAADRGGPAWRRLHLRSLASEVAALEASSLRLAQLSQAFDDHLDAVSARGAAAAPQTDLLLDAMEAAIADLRQEEQTAEK